MKNVYYCDDKKHKPSSHEVSSDVQVGGNEGTLFGWGGLHVAGHGGTREEAYDSYISTLRQTKVDIDALIQEAQRQKDTTHED